SDSLLWFFVLDFALEVSSKPFTVVLELSEGRDGCTLFGRLLRLRGDFSFLENLPDSVRN
ncbi:hypothetical protein DF186_25980, partial [Enterococcus hirae]